MNSIVEKSFILRCVADLFSLVMVANKLGLYFNVDDLMKQLGVIADWFLEDCVQEEILVIAETINCEPNKITRVIDGIGCLSGTYAHIDLLETLLGLYGPAVYYKYKKLLLQTVQPEEQEHNCINSNEQERLTLLDKLERATEHVRVLTETNATLQRQVVNLGKRNDGLVRVQMLHRQELAKAAEPAKITQEAEKKKKNESDLLTGLFKVPKNK